MSEGTQRRLAAILTVDVVGYPRNLGVKTEPALGVYIRRIYRHLGME